MVARRPLRIARFGWVAAAVAVAAALNGPFSAFSAPPLPGTQPLVWDDDIASRMVEGVDRFLLDELEKSVDRREQFWHRDTSSPTAYDASIEPNRKRLAHILGVRDPRVPFDQLEVIGILSNSDDPTGQPGSLSAETGCLAAEVPGCRFKVYTVRWPAIGDIHGEGLLLVPDRDEAVADVIAIPDADQTPEQIAGLAEGVPTESQYARRLAESGCRVLVPVLINRMLRRFEQDGNRGGLLSNREYLYRSAFELGRHLIGYELQKVLAGVDWFARDAGTSDPKIAVVGWGEGGMLALYAAALDTRIDAALVSGYFDARRKVIWHQPIDRNVFGLLQQFGDAELAAMVAPRTLIIEAAMAPKVEIPPGGAGAPGAIATPALANVKAEATRVGDMVKGLAFDGGVGDLIVSGDGSGPYGTPEALQAVLDALAPGTELAELGAAPAPGGTFGPEPRHARQMHEIDRHNQWLLGESPYVRREFFSKLDTSSLEKFNETIEPYREYFATEVIGRFDYPLCRPNVRSRLAYDEPKWKGYEVVLDVFDGVFAYGILLLPKSDKPLRGRPVVVCQHGLEGRAQHVVTEEKKAYSAFAARLAEQGFITFAPQNPYIFKDRFRTLQRKANPIQKTLFSVIVPQHQQIVNWLSSLDEVDPERIAFYGLSYGGKSAMRIPPLVPQYCLSICSGDFNEWVWKNASTRSKYSYANKGEYEIFEFDLGSTFNYAEMAALICPRPFMVERGHFDGVSSDQAVAYEYAKVRHLYQAKLGIGDRTRIEFFVGPHAIHGEGTYEFLHEMLDWPKQ